MFGTAGLTSEINELLLLEVFDNPYDIKLTQRGKDTEYSFTTEQGAEIRVNVNKSPLPVARVFSTLIPLMSSAVVEFRSKNKRLMELVGPMFPANDFFKFYRTNEFESRPPFQEIQKTEYELGVVSFYFEKTASAVTLSRYDAVPNQSNPYRTFATVLEVLKRYIKKDKATKIINFSGSGESRMDLYTKLLFTFGIQNKYDCIIHKTDPFHAIYAAVPPMVYNQILEVYDVYMKEKAEKMLNIHAAQVTA